MSTCTALKKIGVSVLSRTIYVVNSDLLIKKVFPHIHDAFL